MAEAFYWDDDALRARLSGDEVGLIDAVLEQLEGLLDDDAHEAEQRRRTRRRPGGDKPGGKPGGDVGPGADEASSTTGEWAREMGLADLVGFDELLNEGGAGVLSPPEDPALARLLPDAHRDDPLAASEFRRLTETTIRDGKLRSVRGSREVLARWRDPDEETHRLSAPEAIGLARTLTDVRLVLAQRLGVESDHDTERLHALAAGGRLTPEITWNVELYEFLGWMQETVIAALSQRVDPDGDGRRPNPPGLEPPGGPAPTDTHTRPGEDDAP